MKLHYYAETDSLYIDLKPIPAVDSREVADGVVLDFDDRGQLVGIDIDEASQHLDLTTVEVSDFPQPSAAR